MVRRALALLLLASTTTVARAAAPPSPSAASSSSSSSSSEEERGPAPTGAAPAPAGPVIVPPELVEDAVPVYPEDAAAEDVQGDVVLELDIDDTGVVTRVAVKKAPDARLTWAAYGAASNMVFLPATLDGASIPVRVEYTLHFAVDEVVRERALAEEEARRLALVKATAPVNLRGRAFVAGERRVVPGAIVSVEGFEDEAITNEEGEFELRGVPAGRRTIRVDATGFAPFIADEDVLAAQLTELVVYLQPAFANENETVVRERKNQREVTKRVLTQQELTRVPGTFGDPVRVVQRLPGVARAPFGLGAVLVRGGAPEDTAIMIDGHLTRLLYHLGAGPSVLNNDLVERLEFYPGGQGVRFGRAIAGAIEVVTRDPNFENPSGKVTVDILNTGFRLEGPALGGAFFFAGRRSYVAELLNVGDIAGRFLDLGGATFTLAPRYADYQGKAAWKLPYNQVVTFAAFGSDDVLDFALDAAELRPDAPSNVGVSMGFHRLNPVWRWRTGAANERGEPVVSASVSPMIETTYSENRFDESHFRLDTYRAGLRAEAEIHPNDVLGLVVGTDATGARFDSSTDVPRIIPDERLFPRPVLSDPPRFRVSDRVYGTGSAFFVEGQLDLMRVHVLAGLRADLWTYYEEVRTSLDPRVTMRVDLLDSVTLKGNVGLYHQAPLPFELAEKFGNPELPLEEGWQYGAGAEVQLTRSLDVDVQAFARTTAKQAVFVVSPLSFFVSGEARIQPVGESRTYGAELLVRQRLDHGLFGWVAYTLMRSEQRDGKDEPWYLNPFDQTHILSLAGSAALPWGFELGAALRYVTGNPETSAVGGIVDGDRGDYLGVFGPDNNTRLPPFFQVDLRVDKRFVFDNWALGTYVDLQNATNQQNYEFFQYSYDYADVQGFPGLPILPVVGVEASF